MSEIILPDGSPADKRGMIGGNILEQAQANVKKKGDMMNVRQIALNEGARDMVAMILGSLDEMRSAGSEYAEIDTMAHLIQRFYEDYSK